tara:strand:- start:13085 stop:13246 length:162 start_codon:yes stop_codon:yes gene_type:complete
MNEIKEKSIISPIEKRKLEFGNHQFSMCSDIKTKMVWVIANNEEPLLNFSITK